MISDSIKTRKSQNSKSMSLILESHEPKFNLNGFTNFSFPYKYIFIKFFFKIGSKWIMTNVVFGITFKQKHSRWNGIK